MKNLQKILLLVSILIFVVPEIAWSPLGNFIYAFFMPTVHGSSQIFRDNFLSNSQFEYLYKIILMFQFIGIAVFTISWVYFKNYIKSKSIYLFISVLSIVLSLATLFVCYLVYVVDNISLF